MRTKAVIFSCLKHIEAASIAANAAARYFDVVIAMDGNERVDIPHPNVIKTDFRRNGNLNGIDACRGVANTLLAHCDSGHVIKIDSDTIVKDPSLFEGYDIAGFVQPKYPPSLLGCCYAVSRRTLEHSIACIDRAAQLGVTDFPEDTVITGYGQTLAKDDFRANILPLKMLGVWHPTKAPIIVSKTANFGIYRINGNWCHQQSIEAMMAYSNS